MQKLWAALLSRKQMARKEVPGTSQGDLHNVLRHREGGNAPTGVLFIVVFVFLASLVLILLMIDTSGVESKKTFWQNWCTSHLMVGDKDPVPLTAEQCSWMWQQKLVPDEYIAGEFYGEQVRLAEGVPVTQPTETAKKEKPNGKTKSR